MASKAPDLLYLLMVSMSITITIITMNTIAVMNIMIITAAIHMIIIMSMTYIQGIMHNMNTGGSRRLKRS